MEPIQAGAAVVQSFGNQGGILGLVIAGLFVIVIGLGIVIWKLIQVIKGTNDVLSGLGKSLGLLAGILQSKPCLTKDTSVRQKLKDAV